MSTATWLPPISGTAQYPVEYTYDDYGDRYTMTTWRDANNASTTTWNRDAASGALLNTTYQGGNHTTYTWYATGKPHTRVWARSGSVTTTWSWNAYGDLTAINYTGNNPTTPNVSISADATGSTGYVSSSSHAATSSRNAARLHAPSLPRNSAARGWWYSATNPPAAYGTNAETSPSATCRAGD